MTKAALIGVSIATPGSSGSIRHDVRVLKKTVVCSNVKSKFRHFALDHHPDKNGNAVDFNELVEARDAALRQCQKSRPKKARPKKAKRAQKKAKKRAEKTKKRAEKTKKRAKRAKKTVETDETWGKVVAGVLLGVGGVTIVKNNTPVRKKLRRQRSDEDYLKATGHKRRMG